jgi:hypothetical protein
MALLGYGLAFGGMARLTIALKSTFYFTASRPVAEEHIEHGEIMPGNQWPCRSFQWYRTGNIELAAKRTGAFDVDKHHLLAARNR